MRLEATPEFGGVLPPPDELDYDDAAAFYDRTRGASPSLVTAMLQQLGPPHGRTLLEVGCGTGSYARAFAQAGFRVIGLDPSAAMLAYAAEKLSGRLIGAVAHHVPLADDAVDCVVTVNVFHHLPDPLAAFREFRRVARDRTVHHLTTGEQYRSHWAHHYFPLLRHERGGEHPSRAELLSLAQWAGFTDVVAIRFDHADTNDASFMPLRRASPWCLLEAPLRHGVSTFRRLTPMEDAAGALALAADLANGRFASVRARYDAMWRRVGDGVLLVGQVRGA